MILISNFKKYKHCSDEILSRYEEALNLANRGDQKAFDIFSQLNQEGYNAAELQRFLKPLPDQQDEQLQKCAFEVLYHSTDIECVKHALLLSLTQVDEEKKDDIMLFMENSEFTYFA